MVKWSTHTPSTLSWPQEHSSASSARLQCLMLNNSSSSPRYVCLLLKSSSSPHTWRFLSLLPFIFPRFPHLSLLSFSPSPSYPTFHSPSVPSPSPLPPSTILTFHPFYVADPPSFSPSPLAPTPSLLVLYNPYTLNSSLHVPSLPSCLPFHPTYLLFHPPPSPPLLPPTLADSLLSVTTIVASCLMSTHHDLLISRRFVSRRHNRSCHEGASQEGTHTSREFQIQPD